MRIRSVFSGNVQGVAFRYYARRRALELGLRGWVKNQGDGGVELVVEGDKDKVDQLLDYCKSGPGFSSVKDYSVEEEKEVCLPKFEIRF